MYVNPLSIFREYVQNATDAIDDAVGLPVCYLRSMRGESRSISIISTAAL